MLTALIQKLNFTTMKNSINLDRRTFLITFAWKSSDKKFIFNTDIQLMYLIKNFNINGIESIKEFNSLKNSFKRVSKKSVLACLIHNTEASIFLENHSFFN